MQDPEETLRFKGLRAKMKECRVAICDLDMRLRSSHSAGLRREVALQKRCDFVFTFVRRTQEGCGGLVGENPAAFPKARSIFQQPFSLPESAQTLAGIAFRAAGKSGENFPAAPKFAGKPFQQGISDSHSLLEFSEFGRQQSSLEGA